MKIFLIKTFLAVFLLIPSLSWGFFGPSSFKQCKLDNFDKAKTELGSRQIAVACRLYFEEDKNGKIIKDARKTGKCILKNTPKAMNKIAQNQVMRGCRDKYNYWD